MAPISPDKRENTTPLMTNPSTQASDRNNGELYLYNGSYHMVLVDNLNGGKKYIFDNSGKKIYLEDIAVFQMQDETMAKRKMAQKNTLNFFADQENDFASWRDEYAKKAAYWAAKAGVNKSIYEASTKVVASTEHDLRPFYEKCNIYNANSILSKNILNNKDEKKVSNLATLQKHEKHNGNVAFSLHQFELQVAAKYEELMRGAELCRGAVEKLWSNCQKDMA